MDKEVDFLRKRIKGDKERVRTLKFKKENDELARMLKDAYQSYRDVGFSEDQSFWMVAQIVKKAFKNC